MGACGEDVARTPGKTLYAVRSQSDLHGQLPESAPHTLLWLCPVLCPYIRLVRNARHSVTSSKERPRILRSSFDVLLQYLVRSLPQPRVEYDYDLKRQMGKGDLAATLKPGALIVIVLCIAMAPCKQCLSYD